MQQPWELNRSRLSRVTARTFKGHFEHWVRMRPAFPRILSDQKNDGAALRQRHAKALKMISAAQRNTSTLPLAVATSR